jgi:hypothetical protein
VQARSPSPILGGEASVKDFLFFHSYFCLLQVTMAAAGGFHSYFCLLQVTMAAAGGDFCFIFELLDQRQSFF